VLSRRFQILIALTWCVRHVLVGFDSIFFRIWLRQVRIVLLCSGLRCRVVVDFSVYSDRPTKVFVSILFFRKNLWTIMYGFLVQMVFERSAAVSLWFLSSFVALAFHNIGRSAACLRALEFLLLMLVIWFGQSFMTRATFPHFYFRQSLNKNSFPYNGHFWFAPWRRDSCLAAPVCLRPESLVFLPGVPPPLPPPTKRFVASCSVGKGPA